MHSRFELYKRLFIIFALAFLASFVTFLVAHRSWHPVPQEMPREGVMQVPEPLTPDAPAARPGIQSVPEVNPPAMTVENAPLTDEAETASQAPAPAPTGAPARRHAARQPVATRKHAVAMRSGAESGNSLAKAHPPVEQRSAAEAQGVVAPASLAPAAMASGSGEVRALERVAPEVDPDALRVALAAAEKAWSSGEAPRSDVLALIDFSRPSTERRLWVFDLAHNRLLFNELVAHGAGSGTVYASRFSDQAGSRMSSLGTYVTAGTYQGKHGYSLRLKGLDEGLNSNSFSRAVVLHPAAYVSEAFIRAKGYLGRSWGCPAVRPEISRQLIDAIRGGAVLFAYYPGKTRLNDFTLVANGGARDTHAAASDND